MPSTDSTAAAVAASISPRREAPREPPRRAVAHWLGGAAGRLALAAALGVVLVPSDAGAEPAAEPAAAPENAPPSAAAPEQATPEALFERANEAYKAGKLADAEALYRQAYAAKPSFDIGANLARVLLDGKRFAEAAELLARVIQELPPSVSDTIRARLGEAFDEAARESLELKIQVNVDGALVRVDGREVGRTPLEHRVFAEPGEHTVEASGDGYDGATRKVSGAAGATADAVLALTPRARPTESNGAEGLPVAPVVVGAVLTAVLFGVGGAMVAVSSGQESDADTARDALNAQLTPTDLRCPEAPGCADLDAQYESARSSADASTGLFVAGGIVAAATIAYLIVWAASGTDETAEGADRASLMPVPLLGPTEAGLGLAATF